jgi:outer membrane lipoprotein-sorting protein
MNIIRKIALTVPACFFAFATFAQTAQDPKAKLILDEVSKTAKAYTTISASFSIAVKNKEGKTDTKNGSIMMKNGKYKITLENKVKDAIKKEEYYNDGKTTWVYSEKDNEVTIDCFDPTQKKESQISPNDIFTIHEKGFKYKYIKEETQSGKVVHLIDMFPENPDKKNYHTVKLIIDKAKKQILSVAFLNKDGSSTTYTVKSLTPNLDMTDGSFQFDTKTHPGVEVIDLRPEGGCPEPKK